MRGRAKVRLASGEGLAGMRDKYGHEDDAIERFQAKKQKAFQEGIVEGRKTALEILERERKQGGKGPAHSSRPDKS